MNRSLIDKIAQAVLYEGYNLYPYPPRLSREFFGIRCLTCPAQSGVFPKAVSGKVSHCAVHERSLADRSQAKNNRIEGVNSKKTALLRISPSFLYLAPTATEG